jgi:mxaD protein
MKLNALSFIVLSFFSIAVNAHGPTPQKVDESIVIDASIDKTWAVIKDFDQISQWHPDVKSSQGDGKNESDGLRILALSGGDIVESLDYYSEKDHEYNYRLKTENTDALPVSSYTTAIQLIAEGENKTLVKWKSRFYRGDTGNSPSEKLNDDSATKAMNTFVQNGLQGLKKVVE